jgi:tagatose-1,6-bisphosphate aldolase
MTTENWSQAHNVASLVLCTNCAVEQKGSQAKQGFDDAQVTPPVVEKEVLMNKINKSKTLKEYVRAFLADELYCGPPAADWPLIWCLSFSRL